MSEEAQAALETVSTGNVVTFRGHCRNCGARTLRRGYCSRRCQRIGAMLRRAVRNAGCLSLQELVDRTPAGAPVVLDMRRRKRARHRAG